MSLVAVPDIAEAPGADASIELLARAVLSRSLTATKAQTLSKINVMSRALSLYGRTGIPRNGILLQAPHQDSPAGCFPTGATALRRTGMTQAEVRTRFWEIEHSQGIFAAFDADLLAVFFPQTVWPALMTMITEGPGAAAERAERAVQAYARTHVPANKRRREGPPARGTVLAFREAYLGLFSTIVDLSLREFPFGPLASWTGVPRIRMPDTEMAPGMDTEGPRPELLRVKWREINTEIRRRLRMSSEDHDELAALERLPDSHVLFAGLFYPLRDRVVLALAVLTASRRKAIADLFVSDYVKDHVGPPPDYRRGPALLMRPRKTVPAHVVRVKSIPPEFAAMIDVYLAFLRRAVGARELGKPSRKPHLRPDDVPDDFPLLVSTVTGFKPLGPHGIWERLSGVVPSPKYPGLRPLIARENGMNPDLTAEQRAWVGYNPHAYRHTASQLAERAGELWEKEHPSNGSQPKPSPALYASALEDQSPPGDPLRAIYGDHDTERVREILAGRAIENIWRLLTTAEGARKRIDVDAYAKTWRSCRELEAELALVHARADRIYQEADPGGTVKERLAYQTRAMKALVQALDYATRLGDKLVRKQAHLKDLRYDESRWECIPDDAPPRTEHVDIEALELSLRAATPNPLA